MKKKIFAILLAAVLLLVPVLAGCESESDTTGITSPETPGAVTLVKSKWSSGDLVFTQKDGTAMLTFDGSAGDVEIAAATITAGTADALTITTLTAPTVSGTTTINDLVSSNATLTAPSISGTTTINDLVSSNATLTAPSISGTTTINDLVSANATLTSPTISGTMVNANVAMGLDCMTSSTSKVVTHGLSGTPTVIFLTWAQQPADSANGSVLYWTAANSTNFTANSMVSQTSANFSWVAWVAGE